MTNLEIRIQKKENYGKKYNEYLTDKKQILFVRLEKFVKEKRKTLVYFPMVRFIQDFYEYCLAHGSEELKENLSIYYGPLDKEKKNANYLRYRNGESLIMLATKAFGMGIDIADIENVYHFAPTGNVCDYIQEIGRAARELDFGYAYFDFLPKDFIHVERLHGISTIKKHQLVQVISKILGIINEHRGSNIRNILVSADEFRYIFQSGSSDRDDDIDNKVKTALLIIEKDFDAKLKYSPVVARPRSIFAKEFFMVSNETMNSIPEKYKKYYSLIETFGEGNTAYGSIYACDMKELWSENFPSVSFPNFKRLFYTNEYETKMPFSKNLIPVMRLDLDLKSKDTDSFLLEMKKWTQLIATLFSKYARDKTYFSIQDLASEIQSKIGGSKYVNGNLAEMIISSAYSFDRTMKKSTNFYNQFLKYDESREKPYYFMNTGYSGFTDWIEKETYQLLRHTNSIKRTEQHYEIFLPKSFGTNQEKLFIHLGLLETFGSLLYRVNGGDNPEIFIRVNSKTQLERVANNPVRYRNLILENVYNRHKLSVAMLRYLFEQEVDTFTFWELIEDYFLGKIPAEVLAEISRR